MGRGANGRQQQRPSHVLTHKHNTNKETLNSDKTDRAVRGDPSRCTNQEYTFMTAPTGEGGVNREFPNWPRNTEGGERWVGTVLGKKFVVVQGW